MHANPQGYVWYPFTWLFGLWGEYSPYCMNLELVLHIFIAGLGMYFFLKNANISTLIAFCGAVVYSQSGFVSGTSHMIGFTIGAAWLPWCLLLIKKVWYHRSMVYTLGLAMVFYFQITGAYVAFSLILAYISIAYIIYLYLYHKRQLPSHVVTSMLSVAVLLALLISPFVYSIIDSMPYFSRASSLIYSPTVFQGNFSWQSFQTFLVPYIIRAKEGIANVDVSMNQYIYRNTHATATRPICFQNKKTVKKYLNY